MKVSIEGPQEFQGNIFGLINQRRGIILSSTEDEQFTRVDAEVPLSEMFGFSTILRSSTQGKAEYSMEFAKYGKAPQSITEALIKAYEENAKRNNKNRRREMVKEDLIERSAVRNFEKALGGALQPGEVGIVTAKRGVGKTSMLVQLGLDQLLQGKPIVHISFSQQTDYAITWYNNMFDETAEKNTLKKRLS